MNKDTVDFESWFEALCLQVSERCSFDLRDEDSVRADYEEGKSVEEVADEFADEYAQDDQD